MDAEQRLIDDRFPIRKPAQLRTSGPTPFAPDAAHGLLTRLTRLAQRQENAYRWLVQAFRGRLAQLAEPV